MIVITTVGTDVFQLYSSNHEVSRCVQLRLDFVCMIVLWTFLAILHAHLGSPVKKAVKRVYVCITAVRQFAINEYVMLSYVMSECYPVHKVWLWYMQVVPECCRRLPTRPRPSPCTWARARSRVAVAAWPLLPRRRAALSPPLRLRRLRCSRCRWYPTPCRTRRPWAPPPTRSPTSRRARPPTPWNRCRGASCCSGRCCSRPGNSSHRLVECCCFIWSETQLKLSQPSVLWRCWLGGRKGIRPVKNWVVGCWRGCLSGASCRLAYVPADATATRCLLLQ